MIEIKFNPWNEVIDIAQKYWPDLKVDIFFSDTDWNWYLFPKETVFFPEDSDTAIISISLHATFMDTLEILAKSLAYIAFSREFNKTPDDSEDDRVNQYYIRIYDEYRERIEKRDKDYLEAINRTKTDDGYDGDNSTDK